MPMRPSAEKSPVLQRSLGAWLVRYGLIGAVCAPIVAVGVSRYGWLPVRAFYATPILGWVVGVVCGFAGWGLTKTFRVSPSVGSEPQDSTPD